MQELLPNTDVGHKNKIFTLHSQNAVQAYLTHAWNTHCLAKLLVVAVCCLELRSQIRPIHIGKTLQSIKWISNFLNDSEDNFYSELLIMLLSTPYAVSQILVRESVED